MDPHTPPWIVVMVASAGGIRALQTILSELPADLPASVVVVQHRSVRAEDLLEKVLGRVTKLPVRRAEPLTRPETGIVYVARPDLHSTFESQGRFAYIDGTRVRWVLSSANPLFESAADVFGDRLIAVVLTGSGRDGTDGVQAVKAGGGIVIAQDERTAEHGAMARSAIETGAVDRVLPLNDIAPAIVDIVSGASVHS